jgi:RNA polymerase sigma factor (sigma-70 family)
MDDHELLQAYASRRTEDAFNALTERYLGLVYSAAMRQTGNAHAAEDVTQAVFLTLAQKAGSISPNVVLAGWLLRTTRYAAANARRLEQRRQQYEREAMESHVQMSETDMAWQRIAPLLDEAVDGLGEKDRNALVLRFFEGMSLRDVAQRLAVSEDGAQKRVSRALEKLRAFFGRRGRTVSAGALVGAIAANAVQAAPAIAVRASSQAAQAITQATLSTLSRVRIQMVAIRAACVAILLGIAVLPFIRTEKLRGAAPASPLIASAPKASLQRTDSAVAEAAPQSDTRQLLLRVVDSQTGAPVSHARLTLVSFGAPWRMTNIVQADANGVGLVAYSPEPVNNWNHRIEIFGDGYVPKFVSWSEYQQDRIEEIPAEYTAKVDPAVTIGGTVLDEQDRPISEARIVYTVTGPTQSRSRERLTMMGNYHTEVADANGRWSCSHVPARFGMINFKATHPQFQDRTFISDSPDAPPYTRPNRIPEGDFLAGRAIMRLQRGLIIAGSVADESGQPIASAKVTQNYNYRDPERYRFTEGDGSFRFENGRSNEVALTLEALAYAPVVTSLVMQASAEQLRFVLPPGRRLFGRVVNESGEPIAGASIEAASPRADSTVLFEWRTRTDADGNFVWHTAPAVQEYAVNAGGYDSQRRVKLSAGAGQQIVRLKRKASTASVRILGQLLDADTKAPLSEGTVQIWETRVQDGEHVYGFTTRPENVEADGKFRIKTSSGTSSYVLEAKADGYWPKRLTNEVTGDGQLGLDMALAKAPLIAGTVLTPAGEPAAGATLVVRGGPTDRAQMNRPGKLNIDANSSTVGVLADVQGRFRLPAKHGAEAVAIAHPEGFIEAPFSGMNSNTSIRLQPWGRIEGTARIGGRPLANELIHIAGVYKRSPRISVSFSATTGADGRFVFDTVPPGEWKVQREINKRDGTITGPRVVMYSHGVITDVRAGETNTITLGGTGRAVFGKAVAPPSVQANVWTENSVALIQKDPASDYRAMFARDGSFRIEDVPPGEYTLQINLTLPPDSRDGNKLNFKPIASIEKPVTVSSDSDADLGLLKLASP